MPPQSFSPNYNSSRDYQHPRFQNPFLHGEILKGGSLLLTFREEGREHLLRKGRDRRVLLTEILWGSGIDVHFVEKENSYYFLQWKALKWQQKCYGDEGALPFFDLLMAGVRCKSISIPMQRESYELLFNLLYEEILETMSFL